MESMIEPLRKFAVLSGRASRKEYWFFYLFILLGIVALTYVESLVGITSEEETGTLVGLFYLFIIIPWIAVSVRRMHDVNKRGWYILVPFYNLILLLTPSYPKTNKYGVVPAVLSSRKKLIKRLNRKRMSNGV